MTPYEYMQLDRAYFEDFVSRSTYHSNAIEGNTLSLAETYAIQWLDNSMTVQATARELYEAINHKYALEAAMQTPGEELAESLVKRVAGLINKNIHETNDYRNVQVVIWGAEHIPPAPEQVRAQMMEHVHLYNLDVRAGKDPFEREAEFHVKFEATHPFEDGNGRTGRILMQRGLMVSGLAPAVIKKEERARYLEMLADRNVAGLAGLLREACAAEDARIKAFKEARQTE